MSDVLDIVEAAYDVSGDAEAWLQGLGRALQPLLGDGWGVGAWHMDAGGGTRSYCGVGVPSGEPDPYLQGRELTSPEFSVRMFEIARNSGNFVSLLETMGPPAPDHDPAHMREVAHTRAAQDCVMLLGDTLQEEWVGFCALQRAPWQGTTADRAVWTRVSAHVGAGLRLRRQKAAAAAIVATPDGRIEHAGESAHAPRALEAIRVAVRGSERARGRMRREDPAGSLELWKALVSGRWSLVDHFDSDGRRYILARENEPNPVGPSQLTPRQRSAVKLRARGYSLKYIGYELGLSVGTISIELREAFRILGIRSALELGAVLAPAGGSHGGGQ